MKKLLLTSFVLLAITVAFAQSWNPFVNQGIVSPAPMLPVEFNGTGELSFNVGNTGSSVLTLIPGDEMTLIVELSFGVPNDVDPINALGGSAFGFFNWSYDMGSNSYTGIQNQDIPGDFLGTITVQYEVTENSSIMSIQNGFDVTLIPPDYTSSSNATDDDFVSSFTYVQAFDYGDAPSSYGEAVHEIYLFQTSGAYDNYYYMGAEVDQEPMYQSSGTAMGDDMSGIDDEDGVTFPQMFPGSQVTIPVDITIIDNAFGYLNAWIDWNQDGDFLDADEQIATNTLFFATGTTNVLVDIPVSALTGQTFARFRVGAFDANVPPSPSASNAYGEVEDYLVDISNDEGSIALSKTGTYIDNSPIGEFNPGDEIDYSFEVTNTGNTTLTNITVTDPLVNVTGGPISSLAPGASDNTTFSATYTLTQADIDNGSFINVATATGTTPGNTQVTDIDDDIQTLDQNPEIDLLKDGVFNDESGDGFAQVGETVSYSFTVTNTGNVTISNITISDPLVNVVGGPIASLAPGQSDNSTFTATYVLTQADIDAGRVLNLATATGEDPNGDPVEDDSEDPTPITPPSDPNCPDCTETEIPQNPELELLKDGVFNDESGDGFAQVGETVSYTFTVTNTGNVTISNISISDPLVNVIGGPIASLAPGQSDNSTFTATYVLTQADIDAGRVLNLATATGEDPNGDPVEDDSEDPTPITPPSDPNCPDCTETEIPQNPEIELLKEGSFNDESGDGFAQVGETVSYSFTVTNTGNVTINNITISDPLVNVVGGPIASLAPGDSDNSTFTATYVLTQADIDAGKVLNLATATGEDPNGDPVEDDSEDPTPVTPPSDPNCPDCTETEIPQNPELELLKDGVFNDESGDGFAQVGETVSYSFTVTNTGNVTISNITISDPLVNVVGGPIASLAPGQSDNSTFTATYVLTQADIDAGKVLNLATAEGEDPNGDPVEDESEDPTPVTPTDPNCPDCTETELPQDPSIVVNKTISSGDPYANEGDIITYEITVTNDGNVTVYNTAVTDPGVDGLPLRQADQPGNNDNVLDVGETWVYTAQYTVTQTDIDNGSYTNTATGDGNADTDGDGVGDTPVSDDDSATANTSSMASLELLKDGVFNDESGDGFAQVGETVSYTFTVTNTGNVTISNITISDPLVNVIGGPIASLAPGDSDNSTFTATYVLTQADIDAGRVLNLATATGEDPNGDPVEDDSEDPTPITPPSDPNCPDCTETEIPQNPEIELLKDGVFNDESGDGFAQVGETVSYTFTVTNTGNVTISNITISDPLVNVVGGPIASLAPGDSDNSTFTATYVLTQADIDAGKVLNLATAEGEDPNGDPVEDESEDPTPVTPTDPNCPDCTETELPQDPSMDIIKIVTAGNPYDNEGDVISYQITMSNNGNVTIYSPSVSDPGADGLPVRQSDQIGNNDNVLEVGEVWVYTAQYTVTQADIDNGSYTNTATGNGNADTDGDGAGDTPVSAQDSATASVELCPDLTPIITVTPTAIQGVSLLNVTIEVTELQGVTTDGSDIIVRVPLDARLTFSYDPSLLNVGFSTVDNNEWEYLGDNGLFHLFRYTSGSLAGSTSSTFGFIATYDPMFTDGVTTMTSTIVPGSGGECIFTNNTDAEVIEYFE